MKAAEAQKGLGLVGWLVALFIIGFFASVAFRVIPDYMDYMTLKKLIMSVETDQSLDVSNADDFYTHVNKGMQINNIRDLDLKSVLTVTEQRDVYLAHLKYEKREPLIENIDLVISFDHEFSVRKP